MEEQLANPQFGAVLAFVIYCIFLIGALLAGRMMKECDRDMPAPKQFDLERYDTWICDVCWKEYSNVEFLCIIACTKCGRDCQHFNYESRKHADHKTQTG